MMCANMLQIVNNAHRQLRNSPLAETLEICAAHVRTIRIQATSDIGTDRVISDDSITIMMRVTLPGPTIGCTM